MLFKKMYYLLNKTNLKTQNARIKCKKNRHQVLSEALYISNNSLSDQQDREHAMSKLSSSFYHPCALAQYQQEIGKFQYRSKNQYRKMGLRTEKRPYCTSLYFKS